MTIFKAIEMEHYKDEPLQYVGVYVLRWRPEWGEPTVGFVEDDSTEERIARLEREKDKNETVYNACETIDNIELV